MSILEIFIIAVGLAADAFAAALVRGLNMRRVRVGDAVLTASVFGFFQGAMPMLGHLAGSALAGYAGAWDDRIAALLLGAIGLNMIKNSFGSEEEVRPGIASLFVMGIATSVDACAVGISFALNGGVRIFPACAVIALTTLIICLAGVMLGTKLGKKYNRGAEMLGGIILIAIALRLLIF